MRSISVDDLEVGMRYAFYRLNTKRYEPAVFLGVDPLGAVQVQFLLDNSTETVWAMSTTGFELTNEWLQREMNERAEAIRALKFESDRLFDLMKGVK